MEKSRMRVFIHLGPPKTATTSLQNSVIPHLGLPYEIRPDWTRRVARADIFSGAIRPESDLIVSDELLGDFARFPPEVIADRLATVFRQATVLYAMRDPLELFYSLYRQRLINEIGLQAGLILRGKMFYPVNPAEFLAAQWSDCRERGAGFFATVDINRVRAAFERHFCFKTFDLDHLADDAQAFARSFAAACGQPFSATMSWDNETTVAKLETALAQLPASTPDGLADRYRHFFAMPLTPAFEEFVAIGPPRRYLPVAASALLAAEKSRA
jgi:hypothetical protein